MSKINVTAFIQKMNSEVTLQHKLENLGDIESLVNFAAQQGYVFSSQDWYDTVESSDGELDDNSLDQITGGKVSFQDFHFVIKVNKATP
ncbi:MAG: Nif11-like leader peptide family natural product precursor [Chloroflexi bacterium]|uniref:Nif11-like leader peptide family natural product n=1 Tax=Candidatus Chlorohelix allophototropha TaxID=3003348 RepID=A0A8T7LZZ7_9CHLR|nr:Nif11-like leader peptide family natural product precursor [Chloroflexota bacterium]WJW65996.1 Nif11-like leader peptide family natural product precursor [Chloroflexota bacterium L227-S17]